MCDHDRFCFLMTKLYNSFFDSHHSHHGHSENCNAKFYSMSFKKMREKKVCFVYDKQGSEETQYRFNIGRSAALHKYYY